VLDGLVPSVDNLADGSYPYFKHVFAVVKQDAAAPVARFVAFLRSAQAQAILRAHGNLPR
jgi:ABC-type phosphate transport system substrate-binding protein